MEAWGPQAKEFEQPADARNGADSPLGPPEGGAVLPTPRFSSTETHFGLLSSRTVKSQMHVVRSHRYSIPGKLVPWSPPQPPNSDAPACFSLWLSDCSPGVPEDAFSPCSSEALESLLCARHLHRREAGLSGPSRSGWRNSRGGRAVNAHFRCASGPGLAPSLLTEGADGRENSLVSPPSPGVTLRLPGVSPTPQPPQDGRRLAIQSSGTPPGGERGVRP